MMILKGQMRRDYLVEQPDSSASWQSGTSIKLPPLPRCPCPNLLPRFQHLSSTTLAANKLKQFPPKEGWGFRVVPVSRILVLGQKGGDRHKSSLPLPYISRLGSALTTPTSGQGKRHFTQNPVFLPPSVVSATSVPTRHTMKPHSPLSLRFRNTPEKTERGNSPPPLVPGPFSWLLHPFLLRGPPFLGGDEAIFALREAETLV